MAPRHIDYSGKRVLITGGAGFVGSHLARRLVSLGAHVTLLDSLNSNYGGNLFNIADIRDRVAFNVTDIRDPFSMDYLVRGQDYLFSLAGQTSHVGSMDDPATDIDINVVGQINILEACRRHNRDVKVVFASTRQLYGTPQYLPVDESHPTQPVDVNGVSKLAAEGYHRIYDHAFGIHTCVLRLTNTYGPGMRIKDAKQTFLGLWIRLAIEGKPVLVFGDGMQLRDFNYVDDVIDALLLAGSSSTARSKVFNLGGTEVMGLKDLAALLVELRPELRYEIVPFPPERKVIDIGSCYSSYALIKAELGWAPSIGLRDGLGRCLEFYAAHFDKYVS
jgi:UDP-glucose 4-epimerase